MTTRLGVVGAGLMGSGLAQLAALRGLDVVVVDADEAALGRGRETLERAARAAESSGRLEGRTAHDAVAAVHWSTSLPDLADRDLVIEAVVERHDVKAEVLSRLGRLVAADAVIATNTSSLAVTPLAAATARPERVLGLHFFNPVTRMPLVEVVGTVLTGPVALQRAEQVVRVELGKDTIRTEDRSGFVVNRLLMPYLVSAARMLEGGAATAEEIDAGMRLGAGHPMGPLALMDLVGLDTIVLVADALYAEHRDPACVVPPSLRRMVEAGMLGRKSGRGYHRYEEVAA